MPESRGTILAVDDNPITQRLVDVALSAEGYRVLLAGTGRDGLRVLQEQPVDLVLLDLMLPDITGTEVCARMRDTERGRTLPIIAFSSFLGRVETTRDGLVFTDFLAKPVEPTHLVHVVDAHLRRGAGARAGLGRRLLVVDDDRAQQRLMQVLFEQAGFVVTVAGSGASALRIARVSPPDAIVSDVLMPEMDGFRLCVAVRTDPALASVPLVLVSSVYRDEEDRALARSAGAFDLIRRDPSHEATLDAVFACLETPVRGSEALRTEEYVAALIRQVEQQDDRNRGLRQRLEWLEIELGVLASLTASTNNGQALVRDLLDQLVYRCLDSLGVSRGIAYLWQGSSLVPQAQFGFDASQETLATFYGHPEMLRRAVERAETYVLPSLNPSAAERDVLRLASSRALVATPLVAGGEPLGVLLLGLDSPEQAEGMSTFASAVGAQIGQAIALARAHAELRDRHRSVVELNTELEERVATRTAELLSASKELEAFSYTVSHDLRSPLRAIDGFSLALLEDHGAAMPEEGQRYLRHIRESTAEMSLLIDDLLQLSVASRAEIHSESVDGTALVRELATHLREANPDRTVSLSVPEGLRLIGDSGLLRSVFDNLLSNAWKYTRNRADPCVEVGATADGAYFVKDNGIGFEMAYAERVFAPFQRLHARSEYEGTGIGLATVERIVTRHGGRVWAESTPGAGATFFFTLPAPAVAA